MELAFFGVLQEALTNVHRYSKSSVVDVVFGIDAEEAFFTARDFRRPRSTMLPTLCCNHETLPKITYSFFFTRTTVILAKPSLKLGALSLAAMRRMTSSGTTRSRREWRSMQTSSGTSKNTACTS